MRLTWPWNATEGTFTAYYVAGTNTALSAEGGHHDGVLGGDHELHDPLKAVAEHVPYGYAVNLKFEHLCTRLIILNTKNNYAEEYWLNRTAPSISNAFRLSYDPEGMGLEFAFTSDPENNGGAISTYKVFSEDAGIEGNGGYVVLFLEPGKYKGSELNYSNNRPYLGFNVDALDQPTETETDGLVAGRSYILDINKVAGVINRETEEDPWHNTEPPVTDFDIQDFLDAVHDGEEYGELLRKDQAGNLILQKNLDFQGKEFNPRNVSNNITFDGNYHYIKNAVHSVFFLIEGNVRNLEIRDTHISDNLSEEAYRSGALARTSRGYVDNVRLMASRVSPWACASSIWCRRS